MVMPDLSRRTSTRSRFRLKASGNKTLAFRVSHQRPTAWNPPAKDDDDDLRAPDPGKRGKRR